MLCNKPATTLNVVNMHKNKTFWQHVFDDLKENHIENKHPKDWKRGEIEKFINKKLIKKAEIFLSENNLNKENQAISTSYFTLRRVFKESNHKGSEYTKNLFAWYFGYDDAESYILSKKEIFKKPVDEIVVQQPVESKIQRKKIVLILFSAATLSLLFAFTYFFIQPQRRKYINCWMLRTKLNSMPISLYQILTQPN